MGQRKLKYSDELERVVSSVFGALGILAILVGLALRGFTVENVLDGVKDMAGLIVTIAVFILASKLVRSMSVEDFAGKFEEYLKEWADQNRYLVDTESASEERGMEGKRSYFMLTDHTNLVVAEGPASESKRKKGAFVYLPTAAEMKEYKLEIAFRLNDSTFKQSLSDPKNPYKDVTELAGQFAKRINDEFGEKLSIVAAPARDDKYKVVVSLDKMERTTDNARRVVDMVDFVKTLTLAFA